MARQQQVHSNHTPSASRSRLFFSAKNCTNSLWFMLLPILSPLLHEIDFLASVCSRSLASLMKKPMCPSCLLTELLCRDAPFLLMARSECCLLLAMMADSSFWLTSGICILGKRNLIFSLMSFSIYFSSVDFLCFSLRRSRLSSFRRCLAAELTKQQLACGSLSALQWRSMAGVSLRSKGSSSWSGLVCLRCIINLCWWQKYRSRVGLNHRPFGQQPSALPTELREQAITIKGAAIYHASFGMKQLQHCMWRI